MVASRIRGAYSGRTGWGSRGLGAVVGWREAAFGHLGGRGPRNQKKQSIKDSCTAPARFYVPSSSLRLCLLGATMRAEVGR